MKSYLLLALLLFSTLTPTLAFSDSYKCKTIDRQDLLPFNEVIATYFSKNNSLELKFDVSGSTHRHTGYLMKEIQAYLECEIKASFLFFLQDRNLYATVYPDPDIILGEMAYFTVYSDQTRANGIDFICEPINADQNSSNEIEFTDQK